MLSAGVQARTPLDKLTALHKPPSGLKGMGKGDIEGKGGMGKGGRTEEGEGPARGGGIKGEEKEGRGEGGEGEGRKGWGKGKVREIKGEQKGNGGEEGKWTGGRSMGSNFSSWIRQCASAYGHVDPRRVALAHC